MKGPKGMLSNIVSLHVPRDVSHMGVVVEDLDKAMKSLSSTWRLGSNLLIEDVVTIAKANDLCNRYGLDTLSTGAAIAFAMDVEN